MTYRPGPKQALLLWRMISAESDEERAPLQSKTRPELSPQERQSLVDHRFVTLEKQPGRQGLRLVLTDEAWAWAAQAVHVEILKSRSAVGAEALQGLLHRLLPFLRQREIPLADLFATAPLETSTAEADSARALPERIEAACLSLAGGSRKARVRLSALRRQLSSVERSVLDDALLKLQDEGRLVLYRDDNTAALSEDDHRAALSVGGSPRHLVYLEA